MAVDPVTGKWAGYGEGDRSAEVVNIDRRLLLAYPRNSKAVENGVVVDEFYDGATKQSVINLAKFMNNDTRERERLGRMGIKLPLREDGIANLDLRKAIGAYIPPQVTPTRPRFPIQGVFHNTNAFLQPDPMHNFVQATNEGATEAFNLYSRMVGEPIVVIGYSMGGTTAKKFLDRLPPEWREFVKMLVTFGDPCMPPEGSLLGNDPGEGISKDPQPQWVRDRYYSFSLDGDWYPRARGLLFMLYDLLTRAALTMEFAMYLFTQFPLRLMQELMGQQPSVPGTDPTGLNGVLAPLAGMLTSGPLGSIGNLLNPIGILAMLPNIINLLFDALKFISTNAHGKYGDPAEARWDGMTGVDKAVQLIRDKVPRATLFLLPGTWAMWNQGFPMDVAARLQ